MRHVRTLTLCLVAMLALAAFGSTAAWAKEKLPAWGQCEPMPESMGGKYGNAGCTAPVKKVKGHYLGGYEWYPLSESAGEPSAQLDYTGYAAEHDKISQPVAESTIVFRSGRKITCGPLVQESQMLLTGPNGTTKAPLIAFHCVDSEGERCRSVDAVDELADVTAWEHGGYEEPGTWKGAMAFVEDKNTPNPVAGLVYETEHPGERFFQQIVCAGAHPLTIVIGGHKPGEQLTTTITPVNTMSRSFTASLRQSNGVQLPARFEGHKAKPLEAQVNLGEWETVGFEATMLFPEVSVKESHDEVYSYARLELKATP